MNLNKFVIYYSSILFLLYQAHTFFLNPSAMNFNLVFKSYAFFYLFSISFIFLIYLKAKKKAQTTNIFFVGSIIKLIIFFLIFRPFLHQGNLIGKPEISIFLVPYLFSTTFVVYYFSKLLLNSN